jgi:prepilin-type N-terminal cleavage/methylation domain-containing protein
MSMQKKYQGGFTLVEIAIVLVIIGLLLGGVLKGQELIYNQKVKSTYDSYRQYTAAMYGYQDRYRAIPGDDANALTRGFIVGAGPAVVDGSGDGKIAGAGLTCLTALLNPGSEVCQANYQLRLAGFLAGSGTISSTHAFGGVVTLVAPTNVPGLTGPTAVCWNLLPNKAAQQIDLAYDDGVETTGSMRGTADYTTLNATIPDTASSAWTCVTN